MIHKRYKNAVKGQFRALKRHFLCALLLTFLILPVIVSATAPIIENFDSYPVNALLDNVGNWLETDDPMIVSDNKSVSAYHSAYFNPVLNYHFGRLDLRENNTKTLAFKVYIEDCFVNPFNILFMDFDLTIFAGFDATSSVDYCEIKGLNSITTLQTIGFVSPNTWTTWVFQQNDFSQVRYSVNGGLDFTDWLPIYQGVGREIDVFWLSGNTGNVFYIDDIAGGIPICSPQNCSSCYNENSCFLAGCNWVDETCETKPYGVCGVGSYLRFCETQGECEALSGYWVADYCWEIEPPATPNWDNYYLEHSRFETPTTLTTNLVNLVAPISETVGGWLVSLNGTFDLVEATQKGEQFGEAIPIARGYLATINDFFGGFPVSEAFIFFVIISLAIGVFRIVRSIILLIKPF